MKSRTRPTRLVFLLLVLLATRGAPRAFAQQFQDLPGPIPGAGYLGNGGAGIPGPPSNPKPVQRPAGWPGSPELNAVEERPAIPAPHPVSFGGNTRAPDDLSMYRQRLAQRQPPAAALPGAPTYPPATPPTPPTPASTAAGPTVQQRAADAMQLALPGALEIDGATVVAQVDGQPILASELLPSVNWRILKNADKIRSSDIPAARQYLLAQELESAILLKLLLTAAKRKIPAKNYDEMVKHIGAEFYKEQVPNLMKEYECQTRPELEAQLRKIGTSLEREKRIWVERIIAQQWLFSQNKKETRETTHEELLAYYNENIADFQFTAKVRWEQLTVNFGEKRSREDARRRIALAGDQVLRGAHFVDVARAYSDGSTAAEGGQRDWTTQGSLASDVLNEALFQLPVGQMSPILEDRNCFHIIRILERTDAGQSPFSEAQEKIKAVLAKDDQRAHRQKYLEEIREKSTVWTIFDRDQSTAQAPVKYEPQRR